jgi:hypothetical protein
MSEQNSKYPPFVRINRPLPGVPNGATFRREWCERSFIYIAIGGYCFPNGSPFWLTGDFVIGDIGKKPLLWYDGMFTSFQEAPPHLSKDPKPGTGE